MTVTTRSGTVERDGEVYALRFERDYQASIGEVWSAMTDPERTRRWLGELHGHPAMGETMHLVMGESDDERARLDIVECREPHRVEVGWAFPGAPRTRLVVDLSEVAPDRTHVRLWHTGWTAQEIPGYGCGWHHYVDALAAYLAGEKLPVFEDYYPALLDEWKGRTAAAS